MKNVWTPILIVSIFLAAYVIIAALGFYEITVVLFLVSPFAVVWMVYRVLKYGKPSEKKFEEEFYEDFNYKRIGGEG